MSEASDQDLIKLSCAGDAEAFSILVNRHYDLMYRMAYKWCRNRHSAEDVTHNAFLRMAENLHRFRNDSSFKTWLCRIVINAAKDWMTQFRKLSVVGHADEVSVGANAEDALYASEILAQIHTLPEGERDAMILVCGEGFSHAEAGEILGCREKTISWRIHEGRRKLAVIAGKDNGHG